MFRYKYFYCKYRIVAYINGELSESARRRVARFIDECDDCYAEYVRQRELNREIQSRIPVLGKVSEEQLSRIWSAIEGDLAGSTRRDAKPGPLRYGFVVAVVLSILMIPLLMSENSISQMAATQPAPIVQIGYAVSTETPDTLIVTNPQGDQASRISLTDTTQDAIMPTAAPGRTPDPAR